MKLLYSFLENRALMAAITAWFTAQVIKIIIYAITEREFDITLMMSSGGMPSSHSATVCALSAVILRIYGLSSTAFAIAAVFSFIVMYDAAGVRRAAGEQAKVINRLVEDIAKGKKEYMEKDLKELIGHTPIQVFVGAVIGIVTGALFPL